jgi:hypothetical protein
MTWAEKASYTPGNYTKTYPALCNGCHGGETFISPQILFQQVVNRSAGVSGGDSPSNLSDFLLGCTDATDTCNPTNGRQCSLNSPCTEAVADPAGGSITTAFGDILRRQSYMQGLLGAGPGSGGMLQPFLAQPVGSH